MNDKYKQQVFCEDVEEVIEGICAMINNKDYCLQESDLNNIEKSMNSQLISGWLFAYRAYASSNKDRIKLLKDNITNQNPRIREQVCDIIGDEFINDLRGELKHLFNDPVDYVARASKYNHDEMF